MPDTTISNLPAAASANSNAVVAADNAAGTLTEKVTLGQVATLAAASAPVQSVAGRTGSVVLAGGDIASGTVAVGRLPTVLEQQVAVGNSGTATTLSLASGSFQTVTLNGNCTFTMPSPAAGASLTLLVLQNGSFTATFTGVIWSNGAAPVITPTATKRDIIVFVSDGTSWFGSFTQNF